MSNTDNFKWTDELVKECIEYSKENYGKGFPTYNAVIGFKNSKTGGSIGSVKDTDISFSHTIKEGDIFNSQRVTGVRHITNGVQFNTIEIKELKPILFTTEDGVAIYINNDYWWVETAGGSWGYYVAHHAKTSNGGGNYNEGIKKFSTKEAAEEYIISNKPCLSLNDLLEAWGDKGYHNSNVPLKVYLYERFKQKAKEKLKQ